MKKRKPAKPSALVMSISKEFGHLFLDNSGLVDKHTNGVWSEKGWCTRAEARGATQDIAPCRTEICRGLRVQGTSLSFSRYNSEKGYWLCKVSWPEDDWFFEGDSKWKRYQHDDRHWWYEDSSGRWFYEPHDNVQNSPRPSTDSCTTQLPDPCVSSDRAQCSGAGEQLTAAGPCDQVSKVATYKKQQELQDQIAKLRAESRPAVVKH